MDATPSIAVSFRPRAAPLSPVAAVARGPSARALAERLLARDDASLATLAGVAAEGLVLVLGDAEALPWVDGVLYLGRDPAAPALLLPTALEPDVPAALFERAVLARGVAPPVAVLVEPKAIVSVAAARPIERARLAAFIDGGAPAGRPVAFPAGTRPGLPLPQTPSAGRERDP